MSRGIAVVNGAISLLNAVPLEIGSSLAINIRCRVISETKEGGLSVEFRGVNPGDTKLVRAAYKVIRDATGYDGGFSLLIESNLPPRKGLKTSSSVSNALISSMLEAIGLDPDWRTILDLSVRASKLARVTVTGAFDDASASLLGGLVVTDNTTNTILHRTHIPKHGNLTVLLLVPNEDLPKTKVDQRLFEPLKNVAKEILRLIVSGHYWEALTLNGIMVSAALNIRGDVATKLVREEGILAAGVTGMGPSIAVIANSKRGVEKAERIALENNLSVYSASIENKPGKWWRE